MSPVPRWAALPIHGGLVALSTFLAVVQADRDSITVDEGVYVSAGLEAVEQRHLHLAPEQPPIAKLVAGASARVADPELPETDADEEGRWFDYAEQLGEAQRSPAALRELIEAARLLPLLFIGLSGLLVYALAARLSDRTGGLLAAGLWLTVPHVVGVGHFAVTDLVFVTSAVALAWAVVHHVERPSDGTAAVVGLALGAALLSRHFGVVLAPVVVAAVAGIDHRNRRDALRRGALVLGVAWLSVWVLYRVVAPGGPPDPAADELAAMVAAGQDESILARLVLAVPWPLEYRAGIGYLVSAVPASPAYLLGSTWEGARWWYFPAVALVKVPPPALLALTAGIASPLVVWRRKVPVGLLVVWGMAAALVLAAVLGGRNIGSRYLLPAVALGLVAGAVAVARLAPATILRVGGAALVMIQMGMLVASHPHSLAWVNPPADHAYRVVGDSDVDWGQDLRRLAGYTGRAEGPVYVSLLRGRMAEPVPNTRPLADAPIDEPPGLIAVSAAQLTSYGRDELRWLWAYCPVEVLGASILLYRFDDTVPDRRPMPATGHDRPAAPCRGPGDSHR